MATGAEGWRGSLDRSIDAVFTSAASLLICAPLIALFTFTAKRAAQRIPELSETLYFKAPLAALLVHEIAVFWITWAASLALLIAIARATGAGAKAAELIIGFNWVQPLIAAAQIPAIAVAASSASVTAGGLIGLCALALRFFLIFGIIRRGLGAEAGAAAAIVAMLVALSAAVEMLSSLITGAIFAPQS
jgi:hypothetical protein